MELNALKRLQEAPSTGMLLAYTREQVIFEPYDSLETIDERIGNSPLLELHLFDADREYRAIHTQSKRKKIGKKEIENQCIEHVADFPSTDDAFVYKDVSVTYDGKTITVLNRIEYDESGMAKITDVRLAM